MQLGSFLVRIDESERGFVLEVKEETSVKSYEIIKKAYYTLGECKSSSLEELIRVLPIKSIHPIIQQANDLLEEGDFVSF